MTTYQITDTIVTDSLEAGFIVRAQSAFIADSSIEIIDIPEAEHERLVAFRVALRKSEQGQAVVVVDPTNGDVPDWFAPHAVNVKVAWVNQMPSTPALSTVSILSKIGDYLLGSRPASISSSDPIPGDYEDPRNW